MEKLFQSVVTRLVGALDLKNEQGLAAAIGMQQSGFAKRKTRDSLPREQIDALIAAKRLNPQWVYEGQGSMYIGKEFENSIARQNKIHARLKPFKLSQRQESYMAKLLISLETADDRRLRELLDASSQLSAEESDWVHQLRAASPELADVVRQLVALMAAAPKSTGASHTPTGIEGALAKMSAIPDPETARMKPGEKRRYAAAKAAKTA